MSPVHIDTTILLNSMVATDLIRNKRGRERDTNFHYPEFIPIWPRNALDKAYLNVPLQHFHDYAHTIEEPWEIREGHLRFYQGQATVDIPIFFIS